MIIGDPDFLFVGLFACVKSTARARESQPIKRRSSKEMVRVGSNESIPDLNFFREKGRFKKVTLVVNVYAPHSENKSTEEMQNSVTNSRT